VIEQLLGTNTVVHNASEAPCVCARRVLIHGGALDTRHADAAHNVRLLDGRLPSHLMRDRLLHLLAPINLPTATKQRVLIVQRDAAQGRMFLHLDRLLHTTRQFNVDAQAIRLDTLPLLAQASALQTARVLVAMHGAALAWKVILNPNTTILEFLPWPFSRLDADFFSNNPLQRHIQLHLDESLCEYPWEDYCWARQLDGANCTIPPLETQRRHIIANQQQLFETQRGLPKVDHSGQPNQHVFIHVVMRLSCEVLLPHFKEFLKTELHTLH